MEWANDARTRSRAHRTCVSITVELSATPPPLPRHAACDLVEPCPQRPVAPPSSARVAAARARCEKWEFALVCTAPPPRVSRCNVAPYSAIPSGKLLSAQSACEGVHSWSRAHRPGARSFREDAEQRSAGDAKTSKRGRALTARGEAARGGAQRSQYRDRRSPPASLAGGHQIRSWRAREREGAGGARECVVASTIYIYIYI